MPNLTCLHTSASFSFVKGKPGEEECFYESKHCLCKSLPPSQGIDRIANIDQAIAYLRQSVTMVVTPFETVWKEFDELTRILKEARSGRAGGRRSLSNVKINVGEILIY